MYEERRDSFTIKDIILQVVCVILFVCLLLLLFPASRYIKKAFNGKKDIKSEQVEQVNASDKDIENLAKDDKFKQNITIMKDASISYYSNDKLPKEKNEENKLTLNQMYEKNLLDTLFDSNGKMCDGKKSYVLAKNNGDDYNLKINLVCDKQEDSINVTLGDYSYCENSNVCELKVNKENSNKEDNKKIEEPSKPENSCNVQYRDSMITLYFITDGGKQVNSVKFIINSDENKISLPTTTKDNYKFDGWYADIDRTDKVDIKSSLSQDISKLALIETFPQLNKEGCYITKNYVAILYAKWVEVDNNKDNKDNKDNNVIDNNRDNNVIDNNNNNNIDDNSSKGKVTYCEYKRVVKKGYRPYNEWSAWTKQKITPSNYYQVQTKVVNGVTYYRSRSRVYVWGSTQIHWSICDDSNLLNEGFVLTGNKVTK